MDGFQDGTPVSAPVLRSGAIGSLDIRPRGEPMGPNANRRLLSFFAVSFVAALSACAELASPEDTPRPPEVAAAQAIELEPGPPPPVLINPDLLWRSARLLERNNGILMDDPELVEAATEAETTEDVWDRIRNGLGFGHEDRVRRRTRREIEWFQRNQEYLDRMAERARFYLPYIVREVEKRGLPSELALLPVVESAFQPFAYSSAGAAGIWQFMPGTGRVFGLKQNWWYDGRRDIVESTDAALSYLQRLSADFSGDWLLAIAAYNWGEGNVQRAIRRNRRAGKATDFWSIRLPRETRGYVPRLLALAAIVEDPQQFGLSFPVIDDDPYFAVVNVDSQIDLAHAAELADLSLEEIYLLNPGFNRWATDPDGPHRLLLPQERVEKFEQGLAKMLPEHRVAYRRHQIQNGESLLVIAQRYRTSIRTIQTINGINGTRIRAGDSLMVPVASRAFEDYKLSDDIRRALARANRAPSDGIKVRYRVRNGDSLWTIARRHNVRVRDLTRWNGISSRSVIRPGQRLVIWKRKPYGANVTAAALPRKDDSSQRADSAYVVTRGDTLSHIAKWHRTSVDKLASLNDLEPGQVLYPGQKIRLPGTQKVSISAAEKDVPKRKIQYTVRSGDSLWLIGRRFNVSVTRLRQWNNLPRRALLQPGQKLDLFIAINADAVKEG
jgi:membrane-bound lytic murein transglycosylase D